MPTPEHYVNEIRRLHDFFTAWYTGTASKSAFLDFQETLHSEFSMVTPDGTILGREAVIDHVRSRKNQYEPGMFDIEIRDPTAVIANESIGIVRYREHQAFNDEGTTRISTAVVCPSTSDHPEFQWETVHETWAESDQ